MSGGAVRAVKGAGLLARAGLVRLRAAAGRTPRFSGAFSTREAALSAVRDVQRAGYDSETVADVSFAEMCEVAPWDYPVMFWLDRLLPREGRVIDAGGHLGTKFIAFRPYIPLDHVSWTVQDLPGIVRAAKKMQEAGRIPQEIAFADSLSGLGGPDVLLASGLMQYLDRPLAQMLADLDAPPRHIVLNKVALRDGPPLFTLERIGAQQVPYQIRDRAAWLAELEATGYRLRDSWDIPELGHVITTHPWTGRSRSQGFVLSRD